ncbi:hypothetical protein AMK30_07910 [Streptomyces sp. CB02460]|nr:hypothetical protein AMK30_07910 [Streptomyces sp. CB02460]
MPGEAKSSIRPRCAATGPEPGPSAHRCSSIRRPNSVGTFTTSNAVPHGRTPGAVGRDSHWARALRGYAVAPASHAAPAAVTWAV